jgi:hypothetical protein
MRRHVATVVAVALLLSSFVGPLAARGAAPAALGPSGAAAGDAASADPADPTGRWIVLYRGGTDAATATERRSVRVGFRADRTFTHGIRGFSAALSDAQVATLRNDSAVAAVIPDERIEVEGQTNPTGISRIGARLSAAAKIDGVDERVDADVAILDTGIAKVPDLNVAGGHDCSTSNAGRWRDVYGHGTHVAGTVGGIDNGSGVVGVAPGVRLWAVKVIDDTGSGLLSWYACGIDWVYAQRDPQDPKRPLFEAVNMSITKWGRDDGACGSVNGDFLHASICRLVKSGVTVVAAAANDRGNASLRVPGSYDEVITVSALADTDGKPGGLGGNRCFSWGSYDSDDTFADFSNYGGDVDLIAPGKCIYSTVPGGGYQYMSGTSMAAPHVTGAVALLKASRPNLTPVEVKEALQYLGTLNWKVTSDPDKAHEKLLDVSRVGPRGDFSLSVPDVPSVPASGGTVTFTVTLDRSAGSFERINLRPTKTPPGVRATFDDKSLFGFEDLTTTMRAKVSYGLAPGTYQLTVEGDEHGIAREATATFTVTGPAVPPPPTTNQAPSGLVDLAPALPRHVTTGSVGIRYVRGAAVPDPRRDTSDPPAVPAATSGDQASAAAETPAALAPVVAAGSSAAVRAEPIATADHKPVRYRIRYAFFTPL